MDTIEENMQYKDDVYLISKKWIEKYERFLNKHC